jgi:membrane protein DedA with SNARE-associated domain
MPALGILAALLAAGVGFPIPEDLTLLTAGYLVWHGDVSFGLILPIALFGILAGDSTLYWIGRKLGRRLLAHRWLAHRLTPARIGRIEGYFNRHGEKTVLFARFAAGARSLFYLTAGMMRLPWHRFLLFDLPAGMISATVWILVGRRFGSQIDQVRHTVHRVQHWVGLVVVAVFAAWLIARVLRRRIAGPMQQDPSP